MKINYQVCCGGWNMILRKLRRWWDCYCRKRVELESLQDGMDMLKKYGLEPEHFRGYLCNRCQKYHMELI